MTNLKKLREENEALVDSSLKVDVCNVSNVVIENDRRTALFTVYREDDHVVVVVVSSFGDWTAHLSGEKPFGLSEPELHLAFKSFSIAFQLFLETFWPGFIKNIDKLKY